MSAKFADHFSQGSRGYAQARPTYPDALFGELAARAPDRGRAWDCATGSGQAAIGLARHFAQVEATDASTQQVANAIAAANVAYSVQPAEATTFADASFDAICVAQALHWFDLDRFYAEAKRVLRPGGIILVVGYDWMRVAPAFDEAYREVVLEPLKPHWPKQTAILWRGYKDLPFPFERVEMPELAIEMDWSLDQLLDYIGTWTATRRLIESDAGFLQRARSELAASWGTQPSRVVEMPLHIVCGRHGRR